MKILTVALLVAIALQSTYAFKLKAKTNMATQLRDDAYLWTSVLPQNCNDSFYVAICPSYCPSSGTSSGGSSGIDYSDIQSVLDNIEQTNCWNAANPDQSICKTDNIGLDLWFDVDEKFYLICPARCAVLNGDCVATPPSSGDSGSATGSGDGSASGSGSDTGTEVCTTSVQSVDVNSVTWEELHDLMLDLESTNCGDIYANALDDVSYCNSLILSASSWTENYSELYDYCPNRWTVVAGVCQIEQET